LQERRLRNFVAAAENGNDLVPAVGFLLTAQTIEVATAFPDVAFAAIENFYGTEGDGFRAARNHSRARFRTRSAFSTHLRKPATSPESWRR